MSWNKSDERTDALWETAFLAASLLGAGFAAARAYYQMRAAQVELASSMCQCVDFEGIEEEDEEENDTD